MPDYVEPMRYEDAPYEELPYDAVLVVSFGGPEGPDDVMPFLENVLRGKNVPRERMLEVSEHYQHFGGVSPINEQCRQLIGALETELAEHGPNLPVYWATGNWAPMLPDTLRQMEADGVKRAIAFFTSTFSCYSGCRQYRENIRDAQDVVGAGAPRIDKLRMPYNHPCFIDTNAEHLRQALEQIDPARRDGAKVLFTAHSIPMSMAENCKYERQLNEASRLTAEAAGHANWELVYQSRSGPPQQPWLEPDVCDRIEALHAEGGLNDLVLLPIGFVSDHMEVLFDLDTEAKELCDKLDVNLVRAATIGTHPRAVSMIRELIEERIATEREESPERPAVGQYPANHDLCPKDCCTYTPRRPPGVGRPAVGGPSNGGVGMSEGERSAATLGRQRRRCDAGGARLLADGGGHDLGATHADGVATVHAALDAGVNHFDTAYVYGPNGESDAILAEALSGRRDEVVIASKVGVHYDKAVPGQKPEMSQDARPETLRRECDELLGRLKTDRLDLLYLHSPDPEVPVAESAGALAELREAGKTLAVGASNCTLEQTKEFNAACRLAAVQLPYNLLQRDIEQETIPWCQDHGVALAAYWPLMKGLLAGAMGREHRLDERDSRRKYPMYQGDEWQRNQDFVDELRATADSAGVTVAQLVVNWTLSQPGVTTVLCGAKRPEQIAETAGAMGWRLTGEQLKRIDQAVADRGEAAAKRAFR